MAPELYRDAPKTTRVPGPRGGPSMIVVEILYAHDLDSTWRAEIPLRGNRRAVGRGSTPKDAAYNAWEEAARIEFYWRQSRR